VTTLNRTNSLPTTSDPATTDPDGSLDTIDESDRQRRPFDRRAPLHKRQVAQLFAAWFVLTTIYTLVGFAIIRWWEPTAIGDREADVNRWLAERRTDGRDGLAELGSALSNTETKIAVMLALLPVMLFVYRRWLDWSFLALALLFEVSVFGISSKISARERPPVEQLDGAPTSSWPSGHIAAACVFYVGLAMVVYWNTRHKPTRAIFTVLAIVAPTIVIVSRLYQGMHYPTDAIGGIILAAISLTLVRALMIRAGSDPRRTAGAR